MTLATHILIAGSLAAPIASSAPLPVLFAVGIASHYLSDAIPHFDYKLRTAKQERAEVLIVELTPSKKNITIDLTKIAIDIGIGLALVFILKNPPTTLAATLPYFTAAAGAVLPDALQSVYWFWRKEPIVTTKKIHDYFHAKRRLKGDVLGIGSQLLIASACILSLLFI